jgi:group I intron endonuclease
MTFTIYVHTCRLNGKKYVGQTVTSVKRRWQNHCSASRRGSKKIFHDAIRELGFDVWETEILNCVASKQEADMLEKMWIASLRTTEREYGYNSTHGGDGCRADHETRMKMRAAKLGRTLSESTKRKIGDTQRGSPKGPLSPGHRRILSRIAQERKVEPRAKSVLRMALDGSSTRHYQSLREAYTDLIGREKASQLKNLSSSARLIRACCDGKREAAYDYIWRWT